LETGALPVELHSSGVRGTLPSPPNPKSIREDPGKLRMNNKREASVSRVY